MSDSKMKLSIAIAAGCNLAIFVLLIYICENLSFRTPFIWKLMSMSSPSRTKRERNYLREMTLSNARLWFRYRCQIVDHIKGNKSSMYRRLKRFHVIHSFRRYPLSHVFWPAMRALLHIFSSSLSIVFLTCLLFLSSICHLPCSVWLSSLTMHFGVP